MAGRDSVPPYSPNARKLRWCHKGKLSRRPLFGAPAIRAVGVTPLKRRVPHESLEHRGEMRLRLETDGQRDLDKRHGGLTQQFLGTLDSPPQKILMGPETRRRPELGSEVHSAQSRDRCQIEKRDFAREMAVHIFDDSFEPPFLQRSHLPFGAAFIGLVGSLAGTLRFRLQAEQPGDDGQDAGHRRKSRYGDRPSARLPQAHRTGA